MRGSPRPARPDGRSPASLLSGGGSAGLGVAPLQSGGAGGGEWPPARRLRAEMPTTGGVRRAGLPFSPPVILIKFPHFPGAGGPQEPPAWLLQLSPRRGAWGLAGAGACPGLLWSPNKRPGDEAHRRCCARRPTGLRSNLLCNFTASGDAGRIDRLQAGGADPPADAPPHQPHLLIQVWSRFSGPRPRRSRPALGRRPAAQQCPTARGAARLPAPPLGGSTRPPMPKGGAGPAGQAGGVGGQEQR